MNPADLYTALMGGRYGPDQREPPFVAGHDGIGVVVKVRALHRSYIDRLRWHPSPAWPRSNVAADGVDAALL